MGIFDKLFGKNKKDEFIDRVEPQVENLEFDQYEDIGQIKFIFEHVLNPDIEIATQAAEAVHRLLIGIEDHKNNHLKENFKVIRLAKLDVDNFDKFAEEIQISLWCITSMNRSGYLREKALNKLIADKSPRAIPFILFRLADWVVPIRKKAEVVLKSFLVEENRLSFLQNHKLLNWLLKVERADLSGLYSQIVHSVTSKRIDSEQLKRLKEGDRFFYFKSWEKSREVDTDLITQMLSDKYYLIRMLAVKHVQKVEKTGEVIALLLSDPSQKVRQGAIRLFSDLEVKDYQPMLEKLIFDSATSIRQEARRLLGKEGEWDFVAKYTEKLESGQLLAGSILGLSEVSDKSQLPLIQTYLDSERAKIRSAALFGIYTLAPALAEEMAYEILESANPANTKKVAYSILLKEGISPNRLRKIFEVTDETGKKLILQLFNKFGGWAVAGDFLKAMVQEKGLVCKRAKLYLALWTTYSVRLGTTQSQEDKEYVLTWYKKAEEMGMTVPGNIPFIFGETYKE